MDFRKKHNSSPDPNTDSGGVKKELTSFLRDASSYLKLRSELFSIEAKEAGLTYGKKLTLILVGALLLLIGYLLIVSSTIGIIAALLDSETSLTLKNWTGAALLTALLHIVAGLIVYRKGKNAGAGQTFFEYTRNELQNEQEWLKHKKKP